MNLAVKLYQDEISKPSGIPNDWPSEVRELGESIVLPPGPFILMTEADYASYRATRQSAYNAWFATLPTKNMPSSTIEHLNRIDVESQVITTNGNSGELDSEGYGCISYIVDVTAVSGTNPTLDIFEEGSEDGINWFQFTQTHRFTNTGQQRFQSLRLAAKFYRYRWIVGGTSPSFTFSIITTLKNYLPKRFGNKIQYGFDLTQALNTPSETFSAADASNVSIILSRGTDTGGVAGYKIQVSNDESNWTDITSELKQAISTNLSLSSSGAYRFYRLLLTALPVPAAGKIDIYWSANS